VTPENKDRSEGSGYPPATRAEWIRAILITVLGTVALFGIVFGGLLLADAIWP